MTGRIPPHDYAAEAEALAQHFDFTGADIAASVADCAALACRPSVGRVAWFIPHAASAYAGGIHTVLRFAEHLRVAAGITPVMAVVGAPDAAAARARIAEAFPALAAACEVVVLGGIADRPDFGPLDAAVATLWMTALPVLFLRGARRKLYLVQDWEPEFYPAGSTSALAEATTRFGFHALCSSPVLAASYRAYGGTAEVFSYAADPALFHARRPSRDASAPWRVLCYARPGHPRNCWELAAAALREVKVRLGKRVDIVLAGSEHGGEALQGVARPLGMVPHARMGDVYRSADVALCLTASRNPSFTLLELMACGTAIVTAYNGHAAFMLGPPNAVAFECEPTRSELAATIVMALERSDLRAERAALGRRLVAERFSDWSAVCETVRRAVQD